MGRPPERPEWARLMEERHDRGFGFQQCAGRGLLSGPEERGRWLALGGWRTGEFECQPREGWVGWSRELPCRQLHLRAHNTQFLVLEVGAA